MQHEVLACELVEEAPGEANVPAEQPAASASTWLSSADVHASREKDPERAPAQGPGQAFGLIWRIRDRRTFEELRRRGRRARQGPLTVVFLPDSPTTNVGPPRVSYAIGKKLGGAVVRNRLKRRLRAVVNDVSRSDELPMPSGAYLMIPRSEAISMTHSELSTTVRGALERVTSS